MATLELLLLVALIFAVGFASGFAVRAAISRQRRKRARERINNVFSLPAGPATDTQFICPETREPPIAANAGTPHRHPIITPNSQAH